MVRERFVGFAAGAAGAGSAVSAHTACHLLCAAAVSLLAAFGVSASGNALMFLNDYNLPLWSIGAGFLAVSLALHFRKPGCMPSNLILANAGLLAIGVPFPEGSPLFWAAAPVGGLLVALAAVRWLRKRALPRSPSPGAAP